MGKKQILAGAHLSTVGGYFKAIEHGASIGCTTIQIFTKSGLRWVAKPITQEEANLFIAAQKNSPITIVVSHASYLINLGSPDPQAQERSVKALIDEIIRCGQLQIPFLVLHPGTAEPDDKTSSLRQIGINIQTALDATSVLNTTVLVETMAGQGKSAGSSFEDLAVILDHVRSKERIGVCFDTCHVFAAGYDISSEQGYTTTMNHFDATVGLNQIKMFHINDSKKGLGEKIDRHENLGKGKLDLKTFECIMNDPRFDHVSKILETPIEEGKELESHKIDLDILLSLVDDNKKTK